MWFKVWLREGEVQLKSCCIIYKYLCLSSPVLRATTFRNLAFGFAAALPCILRMFTTITNLQKRSQNGPDERCYDPPFPQARQIAMLLIYA